MEGGGAIYLVCIGPRDDFEGWKSDIRYAIDQVEEKQREKLDDWEEPSPLNANEDSVIKELKSLQLLGRKPSGISDEWKVLEELFDDNSHTIDAFDTFKFGGTIVNVCDRHYIRHMKEILV